jgi:hypothetical protein
MLKALYSILLVLLLLLTFIRGVDSVQKPRIATRGCKPNRVSDAAAAMSYGGIHRYVCSVRGGEVLVADTPDELDAILINSFGALVVIDFGAV